MEFKTEVDVSWIKIEAIEEPPVDEQETVSDTLCNSLDNEEMSQKKKKTRKKRKITDTPEEPLSISKSFYICDICFEEFKEWPALKVHIKNLHSPIGSDSGATLTEKITVSGSKAMPDDNSMPQSSSKLPKEEAPCDFSGTSYDSNNLSDNSSNIQDDPLRFTRTDNRRKYKNATGSDQTKSNSEDFVEQYNDDSDSVEDGSSMDKRSPMNAKYKCNGCNRKFVHPGGLKKHMLRGHTGDKLYKCLVCDFKCAQSTRLKSHMLTRHSEDKPYKCTLCDYKSAQSSGLKSHMLRHTGDKPYECHLCSYKTAYSTSLKIHVEKHTGEKPFKCSLCEYKCSKSSSLKSHMQVHTGDKPHNCSVCGFKTTQRSNLKSHMLTHEKDRGYKCSLCDFKFALINGLRKHMDLVHKVEASLSNLKDLSKSSLEYRFTRQTVDKQKK